MQGFEGKMAPMGSSEKGERMEKFTAIFEQEGEWWIGCVNVGQDGILPYGKSVVREELTVAM